MTPSTIFLAAAVFTSVVSHLLLRFFWLAVGTSAVVTSLVVYRYATDPRDPFHHSAAVSAGVSAAAISAVIGAAIRVVRRTFASDSEGQNHFNGR